MVDLEFAHTILMIGCEPLDDAPIFDLRIRKGVRRNGVKLAIATSRPSALDPNARLSVRIPPGGEARVPGRARRARRAAARAGGSAATSDARARGAPARRRRGRRDPVGRAAASADALGTLLSVAGRLGLAGRDGAGLLEIPAGANGRGLREAGAIPGAGPGYSEIASPGRGGRTSPRPWSTARSARSGCSRPTRSAIVPTGPCGSGRSAPRGRWSRMPPSSPKDSRSTPT